MRKENDWVMKLGEKKKQNQWSVIIKADSWACNANGAFDVKTFLKKREKDNIIVLR